MTLLEERTSKEADNRKRTPNTFIVGSPKCGTTYVAAWLATSQKVFVPGVKEPGFFNDTRQYQLGMAHYRARYYAEVVEEPVVVDATPWYLYPANVPERVAQTVGTDVKVIALLREPCRRAVSMYYERVGRRRETRTFDQVVEDELAVIDPVAAMSREFSTEYFDHHVLGGLYAEPVQRYLDTFGPDNTLVLTSEQLWGQTDAVRAQLSGFLGLDLPAAPERSVNPAWKPKLEMVERVLNRAEGSTSRLRGFVAARPGAVRVVRGLLDWASAWNQSAAQYELPDPALMARLRDWYRPANERLEAVLGRPLDEWHDYH
ncbi:MAG: sulfotransferase domain-containing protein [Acidimicrobiales bacterium]